MIEIKTVVQLAGVSGKKVTEFLLRRTDCEYQNWWPGTHLGWHTKQQFPNDIGNIIYFDEYVGKRRLKLDAVVTQCIPGKEIIWQMKKFVNLPAWLEIRFEDTEAGTILIHTLKAGLPGPGKYLDSLFRFFFTKQFAEDMDQHAQFEFRKLAAILSQP